MGLIVLDHDELARRMRALRDGGKKVVFTNGCFDLLHVGHLRCLTDAATRGDFLVVAINSDASVRKLKGPDRPVQPAAERAEILSAITGVSYITIFDEPTVGPLLRKLRPQIVAKGTDYDENNLPEKEVVAEIGAEFTIVGDPKNHSTIKMLERIRGGRGVSGAASSKPGRSDAKGAPRSAPKHAPKGAKPGSAAKSGATKPAAAKAAKPVSKGSARPPPMKKKSRAASEAHA
jgi:rfaE bifunctional protein nucleotidyltransferase chain/domain